MRRQVFANLRWLFSDRVVRIFGGLVVGIWIARHLGPEAFGKLNFAIAFAGLFGTVGRLNINTVVVRELATAPSSSGQVLGTTLGLKLGGCLVAAALSMVAADVFQPDKPEFFQLVSIIAIGSIFYASDVIDIYYQAETRSKPVVQARMIAFGAMALVRVCLILAGVSVLWFAVANSAEVILAALLMLGFYCALGQSASAWRFHGDTARLLLKDGWPLVASSLLVIIHTRIDQVMLGQMLNDAVVGIYSAAVRISEAWMFVPVLVVQTVTPYCLRLRASNPALFRQRMLQLYSAMFWMGVAVALLVFAFGQPVITTLFGDAYADAYAPLVLIVWTGVFTSQGIARGLWMISENLQRYRLFNNLAAVPINISLNYLWVPTHGATGAAWASLVSVGVGTWLVPFIFKATRQANMDMLRSMYPGYLFVSRGQAS